MLYLLRQFITLVETHSFTKASEVLHLSQPALTKNVKKLEGEFGGLLIQRSNKGCSTTQLGEILYTHAKKIDHEMHLLQVEMEKVKSNNQNHLNIGFGNLWQILYAAEIFIAVEERTNGMMTITGKNGTADEMIEELLSGECDLYLGKIFDEPDSYLMTDPLIKTHHSIFAHETHPLFQLTDCGERVSVSDLGNYKWIIFGSLDDVQTYDIPESLKKNIEIQTIHDVNSMFVIIRILQNSDALIILPYQVGNQLAMYNIKKIENHDLRFVPYNSGLIYRKEMENNKALSMVIETIKELMREKD